MAKRKRHDAGDGDQPPATSLSKPTKSVSLQRPPTKKTKSMSTDATATKTPKSVAAAIPAAEPTEASIIEQSVDSSPLTIQIVAGSYDRVLHGVTATLKPGSSKVDFADTFLFNAHTSAIRCLAVSPPSVPIPGQSQKVLLATGATDERINIYNLSAHPPNNRDTTGNSLLDSIAPRRIRENRKNRELGTLLQHSGAITDLAFPTRGKLLSASEDCTIGITRTRDWNLLSMVKVPRPKAHGRPSGDTASLGTTPAGVNSFAIHQSMKLMISVSRGERCMRLWNLVTGKKAGVLNFEKDMLEEIGEGRYSSGEGRKAVWGTCDGGKDEFAVAFERDVVVFGMDSRPKCRIMGDTIRTKVHQIRYATIDEDKGEALFAVSTEGGKVMFFSTKEEDITKADEHKGKTLGTAKLIGQLGGDDSSATGRVKDFTMLEANEDGTKVLFVITAGSDGTIRLWRMTFDELEYATKSAEPKQLGQFLGSYETQNRITCLASFMMIPRPDGLESEDEWDFDDEKEEGNASDDDESD